MNSHEASPRQAHSAVKHWLATALDLPDEDRDAWLVELGRTDGLAAQEVRQLLAAHAQAASFLDVPDDGLAAREAPARVEPGQRVGPFIVERELGRGGMGTVFLGTRDEPEFAQQVAIKVLGENAGTAAVDRLRDERRILAGLSHPFIAHFVDGGTTADGLPYIVMEYVDGRPITAYCDDEGLDTRGRLRLFLKVCGAVHFAHQRLVVHRDIKPSNILVTADGTPKLLDFGIAKLTDPSSQLGHAATVRVLTPRYASPEQARGDVVTTATDVYSLGVLLYELLTGAGPYRTITPESAPLTLLDAIRDELPERPSAAARRTGSVVLSRDLDAVVLKALRKEPGERYGSAEQFAHDLERYLDGQPVLAHAGSRAYRARKFVARHRASVVAAAVVVVSLAAATGVSTWQARVAQVERARAEARFNDVRQLANSFVFEFDEAIRDTPGTTAARRLMIARSLTYLEQLARDVRDEVPLQRELAAAYQRIGDVQGNPYLPNLGDRREALVSYQRALSLRERITSRADATDADHADLASTLGTVGDLRWAEGDFTGALLYYDRERGISQALSGRSPGDATRAYAVARGAYRVGQALTKLGRFGEAHEQYERSRAGLGLDRPRSAPSLEHRRFAAISTMKIADCLLREGKVEAAVSLYRQSADALKTLVVEAPGGAGLERTRAFVLLRVAVGEAVANRAAVARGFAAQALEMQERMSTIDPGDRQLQGDIAGSLSTLGGIDVQEGRLADARRRLAKAAGMYAALAAEGAAYADLKSDHAVALRRLADVRAAEGDVPGSLGGYGQARALLDESPRDGEYAPERALVYLRSSETGRRLARVSVDGADGGSTRWRTEALAEWQRVTAAGVRTWMMEFGGPTRLADAMADAAATPR